MTQLLSPTSKFFVKFPAFFSVCMALTVAVTLSLSVPSASAAETERAAAVEMPAVGKVSLVLGKAYLVKPHRSRIRVTVGTPITVSDQILTEANGHVHIRFIDQALVSVRPDSRLEIIRYDYNEQQPSQSLIKFNLVEGVTRSISGEGARSARDRFRLNTPIAAIGVRGTDFVVSATAQTTRALVNVGTIVLAPYSSTCTAADFGPCDSNAVALTESSLEVIELDSAGSLPRIVPASHEREPDSMREEVQLALAAVYDDAEDKVVGTEVYLENVTSLRATEEVANASLAAEAAAEPELPDFTPGEPVSSVALTDRQLVWGRWADGVGGQELITLSYAEATAGRKVTVGNAEYALFRSESGKGRVEPGLGPVSFTLDSAQAFYNSDSGIVAMQVNGGSLDIDFGLSLFSTELNLLHVATGSVDFIASGSISDRGYFNARSATQSISGAVSQDATEAGYFFQKQLEVGSIQGLTLWNSN